MLRRASDQFSSQDLRLNLIDHYKRKLLFVRYLFAHTETIRSIRSSEAWFIFLLSFHSFSLKRNLIFSSSVKLYKRFMCTLLTFSLTLLELVKLDLSLVR